MSNYRRMLMFACVLMLFGVSAHQAHAASVTVRAPTVEGTAGGTVDVPIHVLGASDLGALHVEVAYDPALLKADTVTRGALAGNNALVEANVDEPGRVVIGIVAPDAINGDGVVANVRFQVIGNSGQGSPLTLETGAAWERTSYAEALVRTEAGAVMIVAGWPWWFILAAIAVLVMLVVFFWIARFTRRQRPAQQPAYAGQAPMVQAGGAQGNYCAQCGQSSTPSARFCRNCGQPMPEE
jgi:hypothetical protein